MKQEREAAQREIAQLTEKLRSKEEFILIQKHDSQESEKKLQQEIAQLKEKLKSEEESVLKQKQESEKLYQQLKDKDKNNADAEIQHQALNLVLESESDRVRDLKKELEEMDTNWATIIAQLKDKIKSKEEFILIQKHESQEQMKKLQQQQKEKEQEITSVYGRQALQALRKELEEKVQEKDEQIQACEMEVKKLLQQSQKKDIKISEMEAWEKTIKDKISSLDLEATSKDEEKEKFLSPSGIYNHANDYM